MLTKRRERRSRHNPALATDPSAGYSRRGFLQASGVTSIGLAAVANGYPGTVEAAVPKPDAGAQIDKEDNLPVLRRGLHDMGGSEEQGLDRPRAGV
jgi:hypothetical protein